MTYNSQHCAVAGAGGLLHPVWLLQDGVLLVGPEEADQAQPARGLPKRLVTPGRNASTPARSSSGVIGSGSARA
jgi:hypothetical protein